MPPSNSLPPNPNAFANSPLDRAGHLRRDEAWLEAARRAPTTRYVLLQNGRPVLAESNGELTPAWHDATEIMWGPDIAIHLFLGVGRQGEAYFAVELPGAGAINVIPRGDFRFDDLRAAAMRLSWDDLAILGCAKSIFEWHARNGFCAKCGAPSQVAEAGWKRVCLGSKCASEHFPRVDPVVIMLPEFDGKCLLGRQSTWPPGMMSALAGYMEPGETIEETVARETFEEAGLIISGVRIHSTQPWPFPASLMIGALCQVESDALKIDQVEIESARWFTKDEARQLLAGKHGECFCPPPFAIAHQLLKSWAED
jgi:NAD+ diphosphatase